MNASIQSYVLYYTKGSFTSAIIKCELLTELFANNGTFTHAIW